MQTEQWKVQATTTGLLVIDVQEKILNGIINPEKKLSFIQSVRICLEIAEAISLKKVFLFSQNSEKLGTYPTILQPFTEKFPLCEKEYFSAVRGNIGEEKLDELKWARIDHIILVGLESHICIFQTAQDLLMSGMKVTIPIEATLSIHQDEHNQSLNALRQMGARIIPLETVLFELVEKYTSPLFTLVREKIKEWRAVVTDI